jgi:hypothetical protein
VPGRLDLFLRRSISEDEERTALSDVRALVLTSDQRAFGPCWHGFKNWIECPRCTDEADRDG